MRLFKITDIIYTGISVLFTDTDIIYTGLSVLFTDILYGCGNFEACGMHLFEA